MQNQVKVTICQNCQGRGIIPGTSNMCENCRGVGALGYDGINEYYLKMDEKGNLSITDVKTNERTESQQRKGKDVGNQSRNVFRYLIFIFLIIDDRRISRQPFSLPCFIDAG